MNALVEAVVTRVTEFGAFVRLRSGVEGLLHVSEMADIRPDHPQALVNPGDLLLLRVLRIEPDRRRIGLSLRAVSETEWAEWAASYREKQAAQAEVQPEVEAEPVDVEPPAAEEAATAAEAVAEEAAWSSRGRSRCGRRCLWSKQPWKTLPRQTLPWKKLRRWSRPSSRKWPRRGEKLRRGRSCRGRSCCRWSRPSSRKWRPWPKPLRQTLPWSKLPWKKQPPVVEAVVEEVVGRG